MDTLLNIAELKNWQKQCSNLTKRQQSLVEKQILNFCI